MKYDNIMPKGPDNETTSKHVPLFARADVFFGSKEILVSY